MSNDVTNTMHVVPINDLIDHDLIDTCLCGPAIQPVKREDGTVGWLTVHHSLDGREQHEA
jgi:hypothetical protein